MKSSGGRREICRIRQAGNICGAGQINGHRIPNVVAVSTEIGRVNHSGTMDLRGAQSMVRPDGEHYSLDRWQSDFLTSRSGTIWGGTAQVQRNIVGERVLGLPKEPDAS